MRLFLVAAIALSIVWQSSCLTIEDGMLVNRCGLWQRLTGHAIVLGLDMPKEKVVYQTSSGSVVTSNIGNAIQAPLPTGTNRIGRITVPLPMTTSTISAAIITMPIQQSYTISSFR